MRASHSNQRNFMVTLLIAEEDVGRLVTELAVKAKRLNFVVTPSDSDVAVPPASTEPPIILSGTTRAPTRRVSIPIRQSKRSKLHRRFAIPTRTFIAQKLASRKRGLAYHEISKLIAASGRNTEIGSALDAAKRKGQIIKGSDGRYHATPSVEQAGV